MSATAGGVAPAAAAPRRRIGASIVAVVAGFATTFVIAVGIDAVLYAAGVYPPFGMRLSDAMFVGALAYRALVTILGGWVTARLAPSRPMKHAAALAAVGGLAGLVGVGRAVAHPAIGPLWYPVALVVTSLPCVLIGARLRMRRRVARA